MRLICLDELSYLRYDLQCYQAYLKTISGERYKYYPNFTDEKIKEKRPEEILESILKALNALELQIKGYWIPIRKDFKRKRHMREVMKTDKVVIS